MMYGKQCIKLSLHIMFSCILIAFIDGQVGS